MAQIESALAVAGTAGADMLLLPELFLPGYNQFKGIADHAQLLNGFWMTHLASMARAAGCGLTLGWAEAHKGVVFNAASAISRDGTLLAHYRKIQLFGDGEGRTFAPGNAPPPVFDLGQRRAGLLICYDVEFPQHAADLSRRGAEIVLVPTANPVGFEHVQATLVPARAYENRQIVAYANFCGSENGLTYGGGSVIVGPDAKIIAAAGHGEALLVCTLPEVWPTEVLSTQDRDFRAL